MGTGINLRSRCAQGSASLLPPHLTSPDVAPCIAGLFRRRPQARGCTLAHYSRLESPRVGVAARPHGSDFRKAAPGSIDELQMLTRLHSLSVCLPIVSHEVSPALWMKQALPFSSSPLFPTALRCCTQFMTINYPQSPRTSNQLQVQMSGLSHRRHADSEVQLWFPCYFPPSFLKSLKEFLIFIIWTADSQISSTLYNSEQ